MEKWWLGLTESSVSAIQIDAVRLSHCTVLCTWDSRMNFFRGEKISTRKTHFGDGVVFFVLFITRLDLFCDLNFKVYLATTLHR
jgi:hypothetical protein